ncbi:MAG: hypothetical protein ACE5JK_03985 [Candidatus Omnitrophota bacterium]
MKVFKGIGLILAACLVFSMVPGEVSYAKKKKKEVVDYKLSSDPRLEKAREKFDKAQMYMERGHKEFRGRAGLAKKHFEFAESYFNAAAFHYRELGDRYDIDTEHEVTVSNRLSREAHVWVSKAKRKSKMSAAAH